MKFARELAQDLFDEITPLIAGHYREIAHYQDIPLDPAWDAYRQAENNGMVRCFTVRDESKPREVPPPVMKPTLGDRISGWISDAFWGKPEEPSGRLVGYAVFFVRPHMHYARSLQAVQDLIYIVPTERGGLGRKFVRWCDEQLSAEGVQVVYQHLKAAHNHGPMLERQGYELVDLIFAKRLDRERAETSEVTHG